jgi:predicted amidophosphoribosyltransferase
MRLEEQITKELKKTTCWNCHEQYSFYEESCPDCGATNANRDLEMSQNGRKIGTVN